MEKKETASGSSSVGGGDSDPSKGRAQVDGECRGEKEYNTTSTSSYTSLSSCEENSIEEEVDPISPAKFSNTSRRTIKSRKSRSIISSGKSSSSEGEEEKVEKCSLLGEKKKKSCGRNSSNYLEEQETVPVPATRHPVKVEDHLCKDSPSSPCEIANTNASSTLFVSNENQNQNIINKLTREEKVRIRKLRRKLAGIGSTSSSERRSKQVGRKDLLEKSNNHNQQQQQQLKQHPHSSSSSSNLISYRRRIGSGKRNKKNLFGFNNMFSKLSCVSCVEVLRECCGVANDEPTNGVKILRRRDPPVDLHTDLPTLSNMSVVQRLKLILEKLESGQLDQVPPEVLQKNIQYAIQLIQDGDPLLNKDRTCDQVDDTSPSSSAQSSSSGNTTTTTTTTTTAPSPFQGGIGGGGGDLSSTENAFNKLSHIRHLQHQQLLQQNQQQQHQIKRQSSTPCPSSASSTSCVATSAALIAAATASAASPKKSSTTNLTTTAISAGAEEEICVSSTSATVIAAAAAEVTLVSPEQQNLSSSKTTTPTTPTSTTKTPCVTSSTSTDLPNVNVTVTDTETATTENTNITTPTIVAVTAPSSSSGGNDNDNTTQTPSAAPPTIVTPTKTGRRGSKVAGGAADDTLTVPESRRRDESDNELSEVDEEVIPEEVRKWLASTFTKTVQPKPRLEPRPRFRSVANAIRVGLFVDRFYRQLSTTTLEIPPDVQHYLKEVNNWHFDIFRLHEKSTGHSLKYVGKELFSRYGIVSRFRLNLDKLENFLTAVEFGYTKLKNPYHNDIHAADVTQTLHYFIGSTGLANMFTDLEIFSLLFAAIIHDFEHTGRTNNFHVNVGTDLALLYNDRSVLENHHVSAAFRLLKEDDKSILSNLKPEEFRDFRNLVVEMVLSTDMSTHFAQIKNVRAILNGEKVSSTTTMSLMSLLLHTADISHPGKPWRMHKKFADTILEEFFLQGDEEAKLGLPFSPLCDRNSVLIPESQIGFIEFIVEPSLTIMTDLIDFVTNVDDSGPMTSLTSSSSAPSSAATKPQTDNSSSGDPNNKSSKPSSSVTNSSAGNANNNASTTPASSDSASASSAAVAASNINSDNKNASSSTTISRVPPPVPLRLGQQKSQIKPFQNLSADSGADKSSQRAASENCIKTAASSSVSDTNKNSSSGSVDAGSGGGGGGRLSMSSRTPSFPLQSGANHNYGPVLRPWINHLCENKAKWRMISAEAAAAAAATVDNENANAEEEENS